MNFNFSQMIRFEGRIGRLEYFISNMISTLLIAGMMVLMATADNELDTIPLLLIILGAVYIRITQAARRCNDLGNSGLFQLIPFYTFVLLFIEGDSSKNEYGPPLDAEYSDQYEKF